MGWPESLFKVFLYDAMELLAKLMFLNVYILSSPHYSWFEISRLDIIFLKFLKV